LVLLELGLRNLVVFNDGGKGGGSLFCLRLEFLGLALLNSVPILDQLAKPDLIIVLKLESSIDLWLP